MKEKNVIVDIKQKEYELGVSRKHYVYQELSIDDGKYMRSYAAILLKGRPFEAQRTPFTKFFMSKEIINLSIETKKKTYARIIVPFLNYVLIDSPEKVDNIEDLTLELANKFISDYASGLLDDKRRPNEPPERRHPDTIDKCENALSRFLKWLCFTRNHGIKMKYIKRSMFDEQGSIFVVEKLPKESRLRLENLTPYLVTELISVALEHDPMLAFGITLQAFVGIRAGDVCQMAGHRFVWICTSWDFITDKELLEEIKACKTSAGALSAYINLEQEYVLRSDGVRAGGIKIHRKQPIFEPFLPIIKNAYSKHMKLLSEKGINNRYNALFIDEYGRAMETRDYLKRFKVLCRKLTERLQELEGYNPNVSEALRLIEEATLGTHSLRYFYTNQIGQYVDTPHLLAYYRGDRTLTAALNYLSINPRTRKFVQDIQDSFGESYERLIT